MDELITLLSRSINQMHALSGQLINSKQSQLCDEIDALAENLERALRTAIDIQLTDIRPISETPHVRPATEIKHELDAVTERMRQLKKDLRKD